MVFPLRGSVHGFCPVARPMKLATVAGALSSNSWQCSVPWLVAGVAVRAPPPLLARRPALGGDHQLQPPVGALALVGAVVEHRLIAPEALRGQLAGGDPVPGQV